MATKTNLGLVEYAKLQLGNPYWYGTFGQTSNEALYKEKKNQYPGYYTATDYPSQYGHRVHDCVGLIKGYLWSDTMTSYPKYTPSQDKSANGMRDACIEKGPMSTMPEQPGILVFMNHHVGIYIGNGDVIEAKGHAYGTIKSRLAGRGWTSWGKCPYLEYVEDSNSTTANGDGKLDIGEVVQFNGTIHYKNASAPTGSSCTSGRAQITKIVKGTAHPYHLIGVEGGSSVYGWVNEKDVAEITSNPINPATNGYSQKVYEWQKAAIADGYRFPKAGADGIWGEECEGVAEQAICRLCTPPWKNMNLTKIIQEAVGFTGDDVDGRFGTNTDKAVKNYQQQKKLVVDGEVGINTWKKILDI